MQDSLWWIKVSLAIRCAGWWPGYRLLRSIVCLNGWLMMGVEVCSMVTQCPWMWLVVMSDLLKDWIAMCYGRKVSRQVLTSLDQYVFVYWWYGIWLSVCWYLKMSECYQLQIVVYPIVVNHCGSSKRMFMCSIGNFNDKVTFCKSSLTAPSSHNDVAFYWLLCANDRHGLPAHWWSIQCQLC